MAKSKKKAEVVFLVCEETGRLELHPPPQAGGREAEAEEVLAAPAQAHAAHREEEVAPIYDHRPSRTNEQALALGAARCGAHRPAGAGGRCVADRGPVAPARGVYEAEAARTFLDAKLTGLRDPDELPGVPDAADRIYAAMQAKRQDRRLRRLRRRRHDRHGDSALVPEAARGRRQLLRAQSARRRLRPQRARRCERWPSAGRRWSSPSIAASPACRSGAGRASCGLELIVTDHHEFGSRVAGRGGDRSSAAARHELSVRRPVRRGRGVQAGLGPLPAGQPGETRQRAAAELSAVGRRPGGDRHGGRRRAAARRESHARAARPEQPARQCRRWAWRLLMQVAKLHEKPALEQRRHRLHARAAAERGRPLRPGAARRRTAHDRLARAGPAAGRVHPRAQRQPRKPGAEHPARRRQAGQGAVRSRGRRGAGAGRPRLACGRDRHRRGPAGREVSPAGRADRARPARRQAGRRLGPLAQRASICTRRWPRAASTCSATAGTRRRPA